MQVRVDRTLCCPPLFLHKVLSTPTCGPSECEQLTDLIILDFSKAFDKVPHKKLLWKLNNYGIRGNIWKWVLAFLSNRMQQVALDGEVSG